MEYSVHIVGLSCPNTEKLFFVELEIFNTYYPTQNGDVTTFHEYMPRCSRCHQYLPLLRKLF